MRSSPRRHFFEKQNRLPGAYAFSRPFSRLDYDPTYPRNPSTFAEHIRKYRKDKGLSGPELARELGVAKSTIIKWEGGRMPRYQEQIKVLKKRIPEVGRFL